MGKTAASTGNVPMALVAFEQYFPEAQGVIDEGLAGDRLTAGTYTRGANGLRREGDSKYQLRRNPNTDRSRRWPGEEEPINMRSCR
jgi:hypothetical protein